jgi:FKBP-type peptidyl-prolyl cis-trans isomerase
MLNKFIAFAILLLLVVSCKKTETQDVVDYGPIDKKIIQDYLKEKGVTNADSTASGLYYIIQKPGDAIHPTINSTVTAKYEGYLTDGTLFDASYLHGGASEFALTQVVAAWQEGLQLIGAGGKITLLCPSALGYGAVASGKIPANSVILFNVELVSIKEVIVP